MPEKHKGILDLVQLEKANTPKWETEWKPATELLARSRRVLHNTGVIARRFTSPFWPKSTALSPKNSEERHISMV
jgi:hypothetical protein